MGTGKTKVRGERKGNRWNSRWERQRPTRVPRVRGTGWEKVEMGKCSFWWLRNSDVTERGRETAAARMQLAPLWGSTGNGFDEIDMTC